MRKKKIVIFLFEKRKKWKKKQIQSDLLFFLEKIQKTQRKREKKKVSIVFPKIRLECPFKRCAFIASCIVGNNDWLTDWLSRIRGEMKMSAWSSPHVIFRIFQFQIRTIFDFGKCQSTKHSMALLSKHQHQQQRKTKYRTSKHKEILMNGSASQWFAKKMSSSSSKYE